MIKTNIYKYLGTNGIIESTVYLEGIYSVINVKLEAENGKVLTKDGGKTFKKYVVVPESEVDKWEEIDLKVKSKE